MSSSATFSKGRMTSLLFCNLHHIGGNLDDSEVLCQFLWSGFDYGNGCRDYGDSGGEGDGDGDDDGDDDGDVTDQVSRSHYLRQWL